MSRSGSNWQLLLVGLGLGLLSVFYPVFLARLPDSVLRRFQSQVTEASPWESYQRYQHSIPVIENHNPHSEKLPEAERRMRMGSKIDTINNAEIAIGEQGIESAGEENRERLELPCYFLEMGESVPGMPCEIVVEFGRKRVRWDGQRVALRSETCYGMVRAWR